MRHGEHRGLAVCHRAPPRTPGRAGAAELSHIALCTDSSSLLSPAAAAALAVEVVPIAVALDGEPFDGPIDAFYGRMREGAAATTSQPSPAAFLAAYARAATAGATSVVSLHLDSRVSGVTASAEIAARDASIPVTVIDLPTVSYGVALCLRAAHSALVSGLGAREAQAAATELALSLDNVFVAPTAPGGRVPASDGWALLRFADGVVAPLSSHPTIEEATETMTRLAAAAGRELVAVGHASRDVEAAADRFAHDLLREGVGAVERYRVYPRVGAHTGPDSFGAFWCQTAAGVSS
ncbi:MAG TPA: DegV family protein [Gaiellaceae bacterium]